MNPFELLELLMDAVGAEYHKDPTRAGVVTSKLADGTYYMSIIRYHESFGGSRNVVLKKVGTHFDATVRELARAWYTMVKPPPVIDLLKKLGAALA